MKPINYGEIIEKAEATEQQLDWLVAKCEAPPAPARAAA